MNFDLATIFKTGPINGATINGWISMSPEFVLVLSLVIGVAVILATVYLVRNGRSFVSALSGALVIAFFCAGLFYLTYSEATWYRWLSRDVKTYWGHDSEEKTRIFGGPFYYFITVARKILAGSDYTVYASDDYTRLLSQYYLLPDRNRKNAKYLVVLYDNDSYYDANAKTFFHGGTRTENAEMAFFYDPRAFILRIR
jgi:hypothetical protein